MRKLSRFHINKSIVTLFYNAFIESVLLFTLAAWFGNLSLKNKNSLNQIVKWSSRLIGEPQLNVEALYMKQLQHICGSILKDSSHPLHNDFQLLPSGRRFKIAKCKTKRHKNIFVPAALTLKNKYLLYIAQMIDFCCFYLFTHCCYLFIYFFYFLLIHLILHITSVFTT